MTRIPRRFLIPALLPFLLITGAYAGGWAIVTVDDLPEYATSGAPVDLTFSVRQHGVTLLSNLMPIVRATAPGRPDVHASAAATAKGGEYSATLTFPRPGMWTIRIDSEFNAVDTTLLPMKVIEAGRPPPLRLSSARRGEHLFVAKGCIGCHRHQRTAAPNLVPVGPDLTDTRFPPDHLTAFLADPSRTLERSGRLEYGQMPSLDLEAAEIAALVAFINRD